MASDEDEMSGSCKGLVVLLVVKWVGLEDGRWIVRCAEDWNRYHW